MSKVLRIIKDSNHAVFPTPNTNGTYSLTAISIIDSWRNGAKVFDTGLVLESEDISVDFVVNPQLVKHGYRMVNQGVLITGRITIVLVKFDLTMPDLVLPMVVAQMIPLSVKPVVVEEIPSESL